MWGVGSGSSGGVILGFDLCIPPLLLFSSVILPTQIHVIASILLLFTIINVLHNPPPLYCIIPTSYLKFQTPIIAVKNIIMDYCHNFILSEDLHSDYHQKCQPEQLLDNTLDDLFSSHTTTEGDVSLEWLSVFVEDCLTSTGSCLPPPAHEASSSSPMKKNKLTPSGFLHKFVIPGKARSKRKRRTPLAQKTKNRTFFCSWPKIHKNQVGVVPFLDPPLLQQAHWLADSELIIMPENNEESKNSNVKKEDDGNNGLQQGRRCSHCLAQKTPQWRAGPLGPKTLCNACGVRYKSGRLFPEYRPAKSPTFLSYKHSNSHKKVLEMRSMANSITSSSD